MADLAVVLPAYQAGQKVRRAKWPPGDHLQRMPSGRWRLLFSGYKFADAGQQLDRLMGGLHCDDWEVVSHG